jgi:1-acyl-sn-glycerol-3-phosphate acyltransferase
VRTVYIYGTFFGSLLFVVFVCGLPLWLLARTVDPGRSIARRLCRAIYTRLLRHYARLTGHPLQLDDSRVNWPEVGPCIVVANHASSMDVVVLMQLPAGVGDGRVWAKAWPFRTPLLGTAMRLCGHLHVEDFNMLPDAQECLVKGESLLIFPESSRSRSGQLNRFRDGAFLLAARTGIPVVPVAIHGTHASMPPGQPWCFRSMIRIEVLGVLHPTPGMPRSHIQLKREAREMILAALEGSPARSAAA